MELRTGTRPEKVEALACCRQRGWPVAERHIEVGEPELGRLRGFGITPAFRFGTRCQIHCESGAKVAPRHGGACFSQSKRPRGEWIPAGRGSIGGDPVLFPCGQIVIASQEQVDSLAVLLIGSMTGRRVFGVGGGTSVDAATGGEAQREEEKGRTSDSHTKIDLDRDQSRKLANRWGK